MGVLPDFLSRHLSDWLNFQALDLPLVLGQGDFAEVRGPLPYEARHRRAKHAEHAPPFACREVDLHVGVVMHGGDQILW